MKFNAEQNQAYSAPMNEDILIAAAAGSGKTRTLSERVFRLINEEGLDPSRLLVLTFTNNAAHEMKSRIVNLFQKSKSPKADLMLSAHIQTFDSLNQYLVSAYAQRLGISQNIQVASESVMANKKRAILDDILKERLSDSEKKEALLESMSHFCLSDEKNYVAMVMKLDHILCDLPVAEKKTVFNEYEERYLSDGAFAKFEEEYLAYLKKTIKERLYSLHFLDRHYLEINAESPDLAERKRWFEDIKEFVYPVADIHFSEGHAESLNLELQRLLSVPSFGEFLKEVRLLSQNKDLIPPKKLSEKQWEGDEESYARYVDIFIPMKDLLGGADYVLKPLLSFDPDTDALKAQWQRLGNDALLLIEIVKEMEDRLSSYKKITNSYTFSDIKEMALRLITEPEFADVAEEVRKRFSYIMVDEYQDTDPAQDAFVDSLCLRKKDGTRSHLFCVGDAKQSIYGFRGSEVGLFRERQKKYSEPVKEGEDNHRVILMNKNYRSGEPLLQQINYLFNHYMTPSHGGIDYAAQGEALAFDDDPETPYHKPFDRFGITRIVSESGYLDDEPFVSTPIRNTPYRMRWEAFAIVDDIQRKIKEGYPVYDRSLEKSEDGPIRPCRYEDFAILTRVRKPFPVYQSIFSEAGIPLNCSIQTSLKEDEPILVISSLIRLLQIIRSGDETNLKHVFASLARSYIYGYSDAYLHEILTDDDSIARLKGDPIYQEMQAFAEATKGFDFDATFVKMVNEFGVISQLNGLGDVANKAAKIEALRDIVATQQSSGEGLDAFVSYLRGLKQYDIKLENESLYQSENAVDMMTMHASKGLERKIVYLPASQIHMSEPSSFGDCRDIGFSSHYGILLPDYLIEAGGDKHFVSTLPAVLSKIEEDASTKERDEEVRLNYVALTRAENALVFVGDPAKARYEDEVGKETLYGMLAFCPHRLRLDPEFLQKKVDDGIINAIEKKALDGDEWEKPFPLPLAKDDLGDAQEFYLLEGQYVGQGAKDFLTETMLATVYAKIYLDYKARFSAIEDVDDLARICAFSEWALEVDGLADFKAKLDEELAKPSPFVEGDEDDDEKEKGDEPASVKAKNAPYLVDGKADMTLLKEYVWAWRDSFAKALEEQPEETDLFYPLAFYFDGVRFPLQVSYQTKDYPDTIQKFDIKRFANKLAPKEPKPLALKVDDTPIEFHERHASRASKKAELHDEDPIYERRLTRGTLLHRYMELLDWKTLDTSFIKDPKDKAIVDKVLNDVEVFQHLDGATLYPEYAYYDEVRATTGSIDLLIVKDGVYSIIDYKTYDIDDDAYIRQLHAYQENAERIFGVDSSHIRLYLVSLLGDRCKEIPVK